MHDGLVSDSNPSPSSIETGTDSRFRLPLLNGMLNVRITRTPISQNVSLALLLAAVCSLLLVVSVWAMVEHRWILLFSTLAGTSVGAYLLLRPHFTSAFHLMILTLPMTTGLLIDIGGNLRLTFIFTALALILALKEGKLRLPKGLALYFLIAFAVYALISTFQVLRIPDESFDAIVPSGFRITPFRSFVQSAQLGLMLVAFCLTLNYLTTRARLSQIVNLIFWGIAITTLYGAYEFAAAVSDIPYISLNTNADPHPSRLFAGTMLRPGAGVFLARPRAFTEEPQILAIILLFGIPFCAAAVALAKTRSDQLFKIAITVLGTLIFLAANSKGSFIAVPFMLILAFVLAKGSRARLKMIMAGAVVYLLLAVVVFPLMGAPRSITLPKDYFQAQVKLIQDPDKWGRSYDRPLEVFRENPLFGVGIGNYPFYAPHPTGAITVSPVYSLQLRLLAELGLIGTVLFFTFVGLVVWRLYLALRKTRDPTIRLVAHASLISISGVMIASLGLDHMFNSSWLWVMLAIGFIVPRIMDLAEVGSNSPEPLLRPDQT